MYIFEIDGKNRTEAEDRALDLLGIEREDVVFKPASSGRSGLFGFVSRKPSTVRVFPVEGKVPVEKIIEGTILTIIKKMGIDASIKRIGDRDGNIYVELTSEDSGILIGKHGRNLDSLQFFINLLVDSRLRNGRRIMVDVESYRERREQSLTRLAKGVAVRVHRSGQPIALDYMNPYERRIVHLALESDNRVYTKSNGNGIYKRVRIIPADLQEDEEDFDSEIENED